MARIERFSSPLHGKTLATAAGTGSIRVVKSKAFAVETPGKFQRGIKQVEETFEIGHHLYPIMLEDLVGRSRLIVEVHFIGQAGATAGNDADPNEKVATHLIGLANFGYFLLGTICYENHLQAIDGPWRTVNDLRERSMVLIIRHWPLLEYYLPAAVHRLP